MAAELRGARAPDTAREVSDDIDHALERRTAPAGTRGAHIESKVKHEGSRLWGALKERPSIGVLLVGGLAVALADAVGVGELAMGIGAGYAAYQVLKKGKSVSEALKETESVEQAL